MSATAELLNQVPLASGIELMSHIPPLATGEVMGLNPAYLIGMGAVAGAAYQAKKIIPTWHTTINVGEVGVRLKRGEPTEVLEPGFYYVPPYRTIQTVYVTDQQHPVSFPLDCEDGPQVQVHANVTWNISPEGDNPIRSIREVMHQKTDKKESTPNPSEEENRQVLKNRVLGLSAIALGKTLTGRTYDELKTINKNDPEEIEAMTIEQSREKLSRYGVILSHVELFPITRVGEQVHGELIVKALQGINLPHNIVPAADKDENGAVNGAAANGHANGNGHSKVVSLHGEDLA